ncbi:unnamed protein product [Calicophoron daubneyi]|uniref:Peptidase M28 domain-containing protein n=1 Tax=Calicophoron daubneyi TaxID=300641 RepID=A0AAV2T4E7_CALDB
MSVARRRNIYPSLLSSNGCYVSNENTTNWSNVSPDPFTPLEADDGAMGLFCWLKVCLLIIVSAILISAHSNSCSAVTNGPRSSPDEFDFRNARTHLQKITALGSRTAGSLANEVAAPAYLRNELRDIALLANQSGLVALVEEQVSGPSSFRAQFHMSTYDNLRNFVLRFHDPKEGDAALRSAFLVNCHYDSAIGSPGASDAFVSCAILLECGRALSTGKFQLKNDIIFLFNGAEENILPSSHAFITQHEWAKDIKAFLNLEGAGAGGRLMVFQVGPGKGSNILMSAYSQSFRQPYATVVAEELFQSGAIPSDTDYRIFRDFGGVPGIDMAYISDGYAYHTPFDTEARISCECLQRAGLDTLKFVTVVAKDERIKTIPRLIPVPPSKHESELTNEASSADVQLTMTPKRRAGDGIKPDVLISICIFYFTFPLTMFCAGPLLCTSANNGRILRLVLLNACLSYAVLVHASPYGFPYSLSLDPHPNKSPRYQRLAVFHMQRTFRDIPDNEQVTMSDSHVSVTPLDVNGIRYLKPNSYPASIPASVLALLYTSEEQRRLYGGVAELVGMKPSFCNYSQPYCGTASLYPYLHYFSESYLIPTTPHASKPHVSIRLVSRRSLNTSAETNRRVWNFTFSVTSGPPNTHVFVRTDVPRVRLSNWSFPIDTPYPVPMPLPTARTHDLKAVGAHYYIYHINPAAVNSYNTSWFDPWNFWLIVDSLPNTPSNFFDIAVTGIYMDEKLSSSSSPQLEDIVSRLPPWVTTMQGCATYKHYRFSV